MPIKDEWVQKVNKETLAKIMEEASTDYVVNSPSDGWGSYGHWDFITDTVLSYLRDRTSEIYISTEGASTVSECKYRGSTRAQITDGNHPWFLYGGMLTGEVIQSTGQQILKLDDGFRTEVFDRQIRKSPESTDEG